jgi:hypothetical protein
LFAFPSFFIEVPYLTTTINLKVRYIATIAMGNTPNNQILTAEAVTYLINHIFLPPKLPQYDDFDIEYETVIAKVAIASLSKFKNHVHHSHHATVASAIAMVTSLRNVYDAATGSVSEKKLVDALVHICQQGEHIFRVFHCFVARHFLLTHPKVAPFHYNFEHRIAEF